MMEVRKLRKEEHIRTRKLWEQIFVEDTPKFLDYYYSVKILDNEIYVIEDCGEIVSMLHLNPYTMRIGEKLYRTHYIVAVATDERYRKRGLMRKLLNKAMDDMKAAKEPFTFLMPAKEEIYLPFGFGTIYEQKQCLVVGKEYAARKLSFAEAEPSDCQDMAEFANEMRDESYYKTMIEEQKSQNGGILLAREGELLVGFVSYSKEPNLELREPLFKEKSDLESAVYHLSGDKEQITCYDYGKAAGKSKIMAKILCPELIEEYGKVFLNEVV